LRGGIRRAARQDFGGGGRPQVELPKGNAALREQTNKLRDELTNILKSESARPQIKRVAHDWHIMRSSNHNERLGAQSSLANSSLPQDKSSEFRPISVSAVHVLARLAARRAVTEQLRSEGVRVSLVKPAEISARAQAFLADHPELYREALERAQRLGLYEKPRRRSVR